MNKVYIWTLSIVLSLLNVGAIIAQNEVQRVRIDCETPLGYTRHLLLGFTPDNAASDSFDYGYDAPNIEDFPDDFNWIIEENRYVIQGVGAFEETKKYPIGLFFSNSGNINISLDTLENFETPIDVFIFDAQNDSYSKINDVNFSSNILAGTYVDRFYITFSNPNQTVETNLSVDDNSIGEIGINYSKATHELIIKPTGSTQIIDTDIYNVLNQHLLQSKNFNNKHAKILLTSYYSGIYLLKIKTNKGVITKRILL